MSTISKESNTVLTIQGLDGQLQDFFDGHDLATYILVPQNAPQGRRPVYVNFHGGFLVLGVAIYPEWTCPWTIEYLLSQNAIFDLAAHLAAHLSKTGPGIEPDLGRICCTGASAGGYLAVQSAFTQPHGHIRAVIGACPLLDVGSDFCSSELGTQHPAGLPTLPKSVLEDHLAAMTRGTVVSEVGPTNRFPLAVAMILERVEEVPFMFFFHAIEESNVPVEIAVEVAQRVQERFGEEKCLLRLGNGEHGFDLTVQADEPWMKAGLEKVTEAWLGN